jgi:hypothetical protein
MRFRFLQDHLVEGSRIVTAGAIEEMGADFVPTGACEALDADALSAVYRAGPQIPRVHPTQNVPQTFWLWDPAIKRWRLTGLGSGLEPKSM